MPLNWIPLSGLLGFGAGVAALLVYGSLFEYALHRWVLHRAWRRLPSPHRVHTVIHHETFGGGRSYHAQRQADRGLILFEWWQGPLLLAVNVPVVWAVALAGGAPVFWGGMTGLAAYYALYEYLHWAMHAPGDRWIERRRAFRFLDAHHRLHHLRWGCNFNVLIPLGDLLFGTLRQPAPPPPREAGAGNGAAR